MHWAGAAAHLLLLGQLAHGWCAAERTRRVLLHRPLTDARLAEHMLALMLGCAQPSHGLTQKHVADGALVTPICGVQPKPSPGQHPTYGRLEQKACKDLLFRAQDDTAVEDVCDAGGGHIAANMVLPRHSGEHGPTRRRVSQGKPCDRG